MESTRKSGSILKALNTTFLMLISNETRTKDQGKLILIALCNVIYKIISKVVAKRLKPTLPILIDLEQYGFVERRQILGNILLIHEGILSLKVTKN